MLPTGAMMNSGYDDAWYLGGAAWENPAIYQIGGGAIPNEQGRTPTHIVGGDADVRVSYLEEVLLERALRAAPRAAQPVGFSRGRTPPRQEPLARTISRFAKSCSGWKNTVATESH